MVRLPSVVLIVTLAVASLPARAFADEFHPLASLQTAEGLNRALQAGGAVRVQDPLRRAGSAAQAQQQQAKFFQTTTGKVVIAAIVVAAVSIAVTAWGGPKIQPAT